MIRVVQCSFWLSFVAITFFATWDRMESLVIGAWLLACTLIAAGIYTLAKRARFQWSWNAALVAVTLLYLGIRAYLSPIVLYQQLDCTLLILVGSVWMLIPMLGAQSVNSLRKSFALVLVVLLVVNIAASYYQAFYDQTWGIFVTRTEAYQQSISGFFPHYNYFANFAMMSAFVGLASFWAWRESTFWKSVGLFLALGNLSLILLSDSRGIFLSTVASILCLLLLLFGILKQHKKIKISRWKSHKAKAIGGVVLILGTVLWLGSLVRDRGVFRFDGSVIDNGRGDFSAIAVDLIYDKPWLGSGARAFEWRSDEYWPDYLWVKTRNLEYVHNEYFQIAAEYGILGLLLVLACLFGLLGILLRRVSQGNVTLKTCGWEVCACAALVGFMVHCCFSFPAHIPACLLIVVVFMRLTLLQQQENEDSIDAASTPSFLLNGIPLLMGCGLMMLFIKEYSAFALYAKENNTHEEYYAGDLNDIEPRVQRLQEVVEQAPNHERLEILGFLAWKASLLCEDDLQKEAFFELSLKSYHDSLTLYPTSPNVLTAYAQLLSSKKEYEEAERYFKKVTTIASHQENWTNAFWHYAHSSEQRAEAFWLDRDPVKAHYYYCQSRELLTKTFRGRYYEEKREMRKRLSESIAFLEKSGFKSAYPN